MPRLGTGWKDAGWDDSPPRPIPKDPKRLAEMYCGRAMARLRYTRERMSADDANKVWDWTSEWIEGYVR